MQLQDLAIGLARRDLGSLAFDRKREGQLKRVCLQSIAAARVHLRCSHSD
jgi:hypothetical protein